MDKPKIRVLLIEDNPVDVILLREALDQDVLNTFKLTSVEKLKAAMQALKKSTFDVILVDLGLPDSQGLETFHKIHQQVPDVPKIILSGLPDEAVALEAVHAGAQDYLVKGMAGTSVAARAIRYAIERQKLSKVIYENELRFRTLIEQSSDAFVLVGADGKISYESPNVIHFTGYAPAERVGRSTFENIFPEDQPKVKAVFAEVLSQPGTVQHTQYRSIRKDGSLWWTESTATNLLNEPGVNGILVNFRDVTERKLAEERLLESQARSQGMLAAIPDLMFRLDRDGVFLDYKADAKDLHTLSPESLIGKRNRDITPPAFANLIDEKINTTLTTGKLQTFEYELAVPGGDLQTFEARMTPSGANEVTAIVRNITKRKQAEEKLRLNELQMHALITSLDDIVFEVDDKGTYCNLWTADEALLFQPRENVIGRRFDEIFGEEMSRPFFETLKNVLASDKSETIEYSVNLGGKLGWFAAQFNPIHTQNRPGNTVSILVRDITQRKESEESLRESEERFRTLYNTMVQGVVYQDANGYIISANPSAEEILGLTLDQMQGRASIDPLWKAIHEDGSDFPGETHPAMIALQTGKPVTGVVMGVFNPQHNRHRWININAIPQFKSTDTKPYQVYTTVEDITERKVSEMALQASEANYRNLVESSDSAIAVLDRAGRILYANAEGIRIWKDPNIVGKTVFDIYDPAYAERYIRVIQSVLDTQTEIVDEEAETVIGGQVMWFRLSLTPLKNRDGSVTSLLLNAWDITERRQVEAALRTSEERYRFITDYVDDIVWQLNPQLQFVYVSPAAQRVLGYTVIESLQMRVMDMLDSNGIEEMQKVIRSRLDGKAHENTPTEYKMKHKDGHWVDVEVLSAPVMNGNGQLLGFVGITRDITVRKQTQIALAVSEQRLKSMIDSAMDAIISTDENLNIVLFNEAAEKMFGISTQDALGQPINRFIPGRFQDRHKDHMLRFSKATLTQLNSGRVFSVNGQRADGREFPAESSFSYVETNNEKLFTSILRDVTERKQAETALQEAEQRYRILVEQSPVVVYEDIIGGNWQYLSPQLHKILGYIPDEFVAQQGLWKSIIHPDDLPLVEERTRHGVEQSQKIVIEYRIKKQDGKYAWVHDEGDVFHDAGNGHTLIRGVFYDITERKQAEEALRESNETAQAILNAATESVFLMEIDGRVIAANETTAARLGKQVSDLIGRNVLEILPPHVAESRKKQMEFVVSERKPVIFDDERFGVWIENSIYPIFDQDGSIRRLAIYGRDITERKRTEALVYAQRDLARAMSKVTSNTAALQLCLATALQVSGMDSGGIYLFNAKDSTLELLHHQGLGESFVREVSSYTADTENVIMLRSGATFQFGSSELENDELYQAEGIHAVIIAPIFYQEQVIGCLNIASHTLTAVPQHARNALETIAIEIGNFLTYLRSESALRASEEKFRLITGTIDEVFWMSDPEMDKMLYISSAYEKVWGYTQKSLYDNPTSFLESVIPEERERVLSVLELQKLGLPFSHEYHIRDAWGTIRTIWDRGYPVTDETGKVSRFVGVAQDITERKQAENALVASEQRLRSLVNSQTHFVLRTNLEGKFTYWNEKYTEEFGWVHNTDDMHQASPMEGVCIYHHERAAETVLNCLLNPGQVFRVELDKPAKDGGVRTTLWEFICLTDEHGQPSEVQCMGIEITELKQTERALKSRTKDLTLLLEAGRAFSEALDNQQIYDLIYHYIKDVLPCDMLVVSSFDPQTELLRCEYLHTGEGAQDVSGFPPIPLEPPGQGTQSLVIRSGQSMLLANYEAALKTATNKYIFDEHAQIIDEMPEEDPERVRSAIIIPLRVEGQVAGAMQVFSSELEAHTEDHLRFVEALAFHISAALSNAKLFAELETRVQQRTAEVRDLYDKAPTGYHSLDASGRFIMMNQTELNWLGYTREEILGHYTTEFITEESQAVFKARFVEFKQAGEMRDVEINFIRKDGTILPGLVNATAIYDEQGEYALSRSTVFDITARKKAEQALRESEEQNRLLFEEAPESVVLFNSTGQIVRMNHTFKLLTGYDKEKLIGHTLAEVGLLSAEQVAKLANAVLQSQVSVATAEFKLLSADGMLHDIGVSVFALLLQGDQHFLTTMRDITAEKQAEETLRLANIEMERALRMKDEFLASMSHELRTPLTGILGLSEALQYNTYGELNEKQLKALATIENSGHHLLDLINDILDISKIEAGRLELNMETCSLGDICQASLQLVKGMAHKKKQNVAFAMNPASISLRADGRRLKQVLVNLLSNAVKYSPENSPLGLEVNADDQTVYIAIWDNGIGIEDNDLKKLFQPFTQLDSSLSRQQSGTGLGLALVQKLIDLHGGSIQVESTPGQGSRFTVVLPCLSPDATQPYQNEPPLPSQLALIIEDNEVDAERLSRYLKMLGIDTHVQTSGAGVIEKATRLNPNVIMLDILLPDSSGWDLLEQLKANEATRHIPIIITSVEEEREKATQLGAAGYLVKLFTLADLKVALARAREITIPIQTGERNMPFIEATFGTVMIVDDNEVNILMIEDFLRAKNFNVLSANSGLEFLARVSEVQPDIVLMDIQMPDMDGLETMRRLRALPNSKLATVPIVAITALAMPGDRERCIAAGANEYLSKPVRLLDMSELIKNMVERGKTQ